MSTDWNEKEREFLDSLSGDTGKDLEEWMIAIAGKNLSHRNEIIDWLRQQGFPFARASWLERIHHNGGRPIYGDSMPPKSSGGLRKTREAAEAGQVQPSPPERPVDDPEPETFAAVPLVAIPVLAPAVKSAGALGPALTELVSKAKAFRPLAQYILQEIRVTMPQVEMNPMDGFVSIRSPSEFAVLVIGTKDLKLGLDLGDAPFQGVLQKARFPSSVSGIGRRMTHMVVLDDARQVDDALLGFVKTAQLRAAS